MNQAKSQRCVVDRDICPPGGTSIHPAPVSNAHAFHTAYVETARVEALLKASPTNCLGIVLYDRSFGPPRGNVCPVVRLSLPQFNEPSLAEVWTSLLPVTYHEMDGIRLAMNEEVLFGALQLEEHRDTPLDVLTYTGYRRLLDHARSLGYPHLLRVWNYFPHINRESDGLERYQRFCLGRNQALAEGLRGFPQTLPAGTAIGTMSGPLQIHFLAATQPGTHVENPRQVNAYEYPRVYGPCSPSFARATLRASTSGSQLLIAGTASVVGHTSHHGGQPYRQALETLRNLNALIAHTERLHGTMSREISRQAQFKVYIRHAVHVSIVGGILKQQMPAHAQVLYLHGEMCRSELLLEIEGTLASRSGH